jgi:hypothetical protein
MNAFEYLILKASLIYFKIFLNWYAQEMQVKYVNFPPAFKADYSGKEHVPAA